MRVSSLGDQAERWLIPALVLTVAMAWGATYPVLRLGLPHSSPFFFALARTAAGAFLIVAVALLLRRPVPVGWKTHGLLALCGLLNFTAFYAGMNLALLHLPAAETAMLNYTSPFWMALLAHLALGEPLGRRRVLGLTTGFVGVALVLMTRIQPHAAAPWGAYVAVLGGALAFSVGSVFFVHRMSSVPLEWGVGLQTLYGSIGFIPLWLGTGSVTGDGSPTFWSTLLFVILFPSFVAQLAFFSLLRRRGAVVSGTYIFLVPIFAAFGGFILLGEAIGPWTLAGGVCVIMGIHLVNRPVARPITESPQSAVPHPGHGPRGVA